ncbi:MAG: peptide chain release factor N(5)-glutamine methyltransferase [Alphaproteobacteria bacterium]|nr:peptide chain release factor N(5)-glutamine methyltransferase [Alphaproteobacteria bacterium]
MTALAEATAGALLAPAARLLAAAGIEDAAREARLLLAHAAGCQATLLAVDPARQIAADAAAAFEAALARRAAREPLAQITGMREFWSLDFRVTADVLIPRPDSETLLEAACALRPDRTVPLRVLDLGTGSGCLLLAALSEYPAATGLGVDISAPALAVARDNAVRLGLAGRARFVRADWDSGLDARFDLVLCNPPYVADGEVGSLAPEVARFEPKLALCGGADGLAAYRALAPALARRLTPGGLALVEAGSGQAPDIDHIFRKWGLAVPAVRRDLAGIARCVVATMPAAFTAA